MDNEPENLAVKALLDRRRYCANWAETERSQEAQFRLQADTKAEQASKHEREVAQIDAALEALHHGEETVRIDVPKRAITDALGGLSE